MGYIILMILALIIIYLISKLVKKIVNVFREFFLFLQRYIKACCLIGLILISVYLIIDYFYIGISILLFLGIHLINNKQKIKRWIKEKSPIFTEEQVDSTLISILQKNIRNDNNVEEYKFNETKIPYGRVNAFLNYFDKSIDTDEVYYFSAIKSYDINELREYGTAITRNGVYISKQINCNEKIEVEQKVIPFGGLRKVEVKENKLIINYIDIKSISEKIITLNSTDTTIPINEIKQVFNEVINNKFNHALCKGGIVLKEEYREKLDEGTKKQNSNKEVKVAEDIGTVAGIMGASENFSNEYVEIKNYMNGSRGNGYAAEYANNTIDKLRGNDVINAAQDLDENGRQVKYGPDRIVNGEKIQTKYYKTASESIGAAFKNKEAIYMRNDGSGKMMAIEVPRDQYNEAVKIMQKRIDSGQVPNVEPGEDAKDYVKKGYFTYAQSFNICKAGTIESLTIDAIDGAICSSMAGGISAAIVFGIAIWNGKNVKDAAKAGINAGVKVLGKGTFIFTLTMQLSREQFANPFIKEYTKDGIYKGLAGINNPLFKVSENIAEGIRKSAIAKTSIGEAMGLPSITGKAVMGNTVTAVIVFGPDICRALSGKISTKQLFKNSAIGASGIGGSMIGQALIPIPVVGGIIGGFVGGFVAKNILDTFIEDDAKIMFQILKEEFLDVVMMSNLTKEEFDELSNMTICSGNLSIMLRDMYASQDYRRCAREAMVNVAVINVITKRNKVTSDMINRGYEQLLLEM